MERGLEPKERARKQDRWIEPTRNQRRLLKEGASNQRRGTGTKGEGQKPNERDRNRRKGQEPNVKVRNQRRGL